MRLPVGTQILAEDGETILADLTREGQEFILAQGGMGGKGNAFFKSSTNRAPRKSQPGVKGVEFWVWLRLKLIADAGLLGMPNAGKSTFLAAVSAARPKIADYPFTTLHPNLGVVGIDGHEFVMADIPGLIRGASEGAGIGHRFLGHVERCRVLFHLIDATQSDPIEAYHTIRDELVAYDETGLAQKREIIALSKADSAPADYLEDLKAALKAEGASDVMVMSSVTGQGVTEVLRAIYGVITDDIAAELAREQDDEPWSP